MWHILLDFSMIIALQLGHISILEGLERTMELYKEILAKVLEQESIHVIFPDLNINASEIVETQSYRALEKIKAIIEDDSLSEFMCIEKIVCVLEEIGSDGGTRHDF